MGKGVKVFSISGAKGKKMTPIEEWESEIYLESRNGRSAAESLMFHLKNLFESHLILFNIKQIIAT